jgi:predicted Zn-dependent protease
MTTAPSTRTRFITFLITFRTAALVLFALSIAVGAAAQSKGNVRVNGKILDDTGKPAADVMVRAIKSGDAQIFEARTNDKGEWQIPNLTAGQWNFEFGKNGFEPVRMEVKVADRNNPPIETKLAKAAPAVDPNVEIQEELKKAMALQSGGKGAEARKVIEDVLAKYPVAYRLNAFIATTYQEEKNYDKAIEHVTIVVDKEPADIDMKLFLAELMAAKGDKEGAQKILDGIDMAQVKDATMFINQAIGMINGGRPDDAVALLDKLAAQFPTRADILYYRARAKIVGKKMVEAKADLEKFVSMAPPDARELPDAKKLLEQLKDVK